jgi:hypothetical protein
MEVVVAMMLAVGVGAAVINALISAAKLAQPPPERYTAYNLARQNSETLTNAVRDDTWNSGGLAPGNYVLASTTLNSVAYSPQYTVVNVDVDADGQTDYRKTDTSVQW